MNTAANWCSASELEAEDLNCSRVRVSSLCEMSWQPILLTGMLRDHLIRHFAEPLTIESRDLRQYVWRTDERTGILIETVHKWQGDPVEKRPAVLVKRNAYRSQRIAINDLAGVNEKGEEDFSVLWIGSHTLFCIHGTGASVDILATEVQREINQYSPVIRQYLGLQKFSVTEVGAISELEEASENYVVPITVGWAYSENWRIKVESLPLRRLPLSIILECPLNGNILSLDG
jgi:hypothetical protein